ncbi:MAG TPA: AEC family transporter [Mobilitalea sp.]|nr:AEC family transporter [Mobilitalea sp.]
MTLSGILLNQILIIFIIIFIGVICYKTNLIDDDTNRKLSDILLYLVTPAVIFVSYQKDFSTELMEGLLLSLLFATVVHAVGIVISYILIRKKKRIFVTVDGKRINKIAENENFEVERFASSYSNVGYMGIPLVSGIYGSEGVFYVTAYITLFNLLIWTHGVMMMSGKKELNFKKLARMLLSPSIISIFLGLICFVLQIKVPKVFYDALSHLASLNTPLAMLVAGVTIGKTNIIKILTSNIRIYYVLFIKLILLPLLIIALIIKLPVKEIVKIIAIIMAASPSATTVILFSLKYKKNSVLAAEIFTLAVLFCAATIPLIVRITESFL